MLTDWLGLHDRRSTGVFLLAIGCVIVFVTMATLRTGHARGNLLFAASMASWLGGMLVGRRWHYLAKTPRQIVGERMREGVRMGFAEKLLLRLTIVLAPLAIYAHYAA